jgi:hypothetical protein
MTHLKVKLVLFISTTTTRCVTAQKSAVLFLFLKSELFQCPRMASFSKFRKKKQTNSSWNRDRHRGKQQVQGLKSESVIWRSGYFQNTTKCNLFIMLTTTCFGQCWPSSGHKKYIGGKKITVRDNLGTTNTSHGVVHTCRTLLCHVSRKP